MYGAGYGVANLLHLYADPDSAFHFNADAELQIRTGSSSQWWDPSIVSVQGPSRL